VHQKEVTERRRRDVENSLQEKASSQIQQAYKSYRIRSFGKAVRDEV